MTSVARLLRLGVGAVVWASVVALSIRLWASGAISRYEPVEQFSAFFLKEHFEVEVAFEPVFNPTPGTRVSYVDESLRPVPFGEITRARHPAGGGTVLTLWVYPNARLYAMRGLDLRFITPPESVGEVLQTLIDPRAQARLKAIWERFLSEHQKEITDLVLPYLERRLDAYLSLIEPAFRAALRDAQDDFETLLKRHYRTTVAQKVLPVLQARVWAIARERFTPKLREIGQELYEALPVTSLGLNYLRDRLVPWEDPTNVMERFERYLAEDGMPIITKYEPALLALFEQTVSDAAYDSEITTVTHEALNAVLHDPELGRILRQIVGASIVENEATLTFVTDTWRDPDLRWRLDRIGRLLERQLNVAINEIVLDETQTKINPNLAIVLRRQVLYKHDLRFVARSPGLLGAPLTPEALRPVEPGYRYQGHRLR